MIAGRLSDIVLIRTRWHHASSAGAVAPVAAIGSEQMDTQDPAQAVAFEGDKRFRASTATATCGLTRARPLHEGGSVIEECTLMEAQRAVGDSRTRGASSLVPAA